MSLNDISKKQILDCLKELSNLEFQERVWVRGEGPEVSSYSELICQLYDDTLLGDSLEESDEKPVFDDGIDSILNELSSLLDKIDGTLEAKSIIAHPRWPKILLLATKATKLIEDYLG